VIPELTTSPIKLHWRSHHPHSSRHPPRPYKRLSRRPRRLEPVQLCLHGAEEVFAQALPQGDAGEVADQLLPCHDVPVPGLASLQRLHRLLRHLGSAEGVEQLGVASAEPLGVRMTVPHGRHRLAQDPLHVVTDVRQRHLSGLLPVLLRPPGVGQAVGGRQPCDHDTDQVCGKPGQLQPRRNLRDVRRLLHGHVSSSLAEPLCARYRLITVSRCGPQAPNWLPIDPPAGSEPQASRLSSPSRRSRAASASGVRVKVDPGALQNITSASSRRAASAAWLVGMGAWAALLPPMGRPGAFTSSTRAPESSVA